MITEILEPSIKNSSIRISDVEKTERGWECDWHIHDECEMNLILESSMTYILNDKSYKLDVGDIIFLNSNVPHHTITEKGTQSILFQFDIGVKTKNLYKTLSHYINTSGANATLFKTGTKECNELKACLNNIISENATKQNAYEDFIIAETYKIIAILYRYDIIKNPESFFSAERIKKIMPVLDYIHNNYSKNISLEEMSELINVNKSHFCRLFKKAVNVSLIDYINFVRVSKAESLLLSTEDSILEIAELVGFSSSAYFTKIFKNIKSCTPSQYRKYKKIS